MKWRSVHGIPGDQVIHEVAVNVGRNLLLLVTAFVLLLLLGHAFPLVASFGRWVFLVVGVVLALRFFFGCLVGLADSVLEGAGGGKMEGSGWIVFVTGARILELVVAWGMTWILFRRYS
jgi:hypothetical protein